MAAVRTHELRRRILVRPGGRETTTLVFCPYRCRTVSLEFHLECEHGGGPQPAPEGEGRVVRCARPGMDEAAPPRARPASHWRLPEPPPLPTAAAGVQVAALMSRHTVCVSPGLPAATLQALLIEHGIGGVPVVAVGGAPIGVASKTDLVAAGGTVEELLPEDAPLTVAELMTPFALTLPETAPVSQAAAFMAHKGIHRLPIVGEDGALVGVLSSLDVLRWLGESDGYLAEQGRSAPSGA